MRPGAHHLIIIVLTCLCGVRAGAAPAASLLHVIVNVSDTHSIPAAVRRGVVAEAARLWRPYDVSVDEVRALSCAADDFLLTVIVDGSGDPGEGENGLGSLRFASGGSPA